MIFPIADLVPDICGDLSARDIRAIACTCRDVHQMIAPFMEERTEEIARNSQTCRITHYRTMWPRLHRTIKHRLAIHSELFNVNRSILDATGSGVLMITCKTRYGYCNKIYICVRDGLAQYGINIEKYMIWREYTVRHVYATPSRIPFVDFIDMFMNFILHGIHWDGRISNELGYELSAKARTHGYPSMEEYIGSADFIKMLAQW